MDDPFLEDFLLGFFFADTLSVDSAEARETWSSASCWLPCGDVNTLGEVVRTGVARKKSEGR